MVAVALAGTGCGDGKDTGSTTDGATTGATTGATIGETVDESVGTTEQTTAGETTQTSETTSTSDPTSSTSETSSSSDPSTSSGEDCSGFYDEQNIGPAVEVAVLNTRQEPMYVQVLSECDMQVFELLGPDADIPTPWQLTDCWTCEGGINGNCVCPGEPCFYTSFLRLEPGASYRGAWFGAVYQAHDLPPECVNGMCGSTCSQRVQASAGNYTFRVRAGAQVSGCDGSCDCLPNGEGWCFVEGGGGSIDGEPTVASTSFAYPEQTLVDVPIE